MLAAKIGNDSRVVVWSLTSGEMIQEIVSPAAGYISAITWIDVDDRGETTFAFGVLDGNIQIYERTNDVSVMVVVPLGQEVCVTKNQDTDMLKFQGWY